MTPDDLKLRELLDSDRFHPARPPDVVRVQLSHMSRAGIVTELDLTIDAAMVRLASNPRHFIANEILRSMRDFTDCVCSTPKPTEHPGG